MAFEHDAIDRHLFTRPYAKPVPDRDLIESQVRFASMLVHTPSHLRSQIEQRTDRAAGLTAGPQLHHLPE